jgi:hypothetical protein
MKHQIYKMNFKCLKSCVFKAHVSLLQVVLRRRSGRDGKYSCVYKSVFAYSTPFKNPIYFPFIISLHEVQKTKITIVRLVILTVRLSTY